MRRDVFQAISDPTRREIIQLIAHQPLNLNAIAENFQMSRPAISQHMKVLIECGLVSVDKKVRPGWKSSAKLPNGWNNTSKHGKRSTTGSTKCLKK